MSNIDKLIINSPFNILKNIRLHKDDSTIVSDSPFYPEPNYNYIKDKLSASNNFFVPTSYENVETGWLAFPLILQNELAYKRKEIQIFLENNGIQTRTIFTGNILRQPVAKKFKWASFGSFDISDNIMESGILLGCHNRQTKEKMDYMLGKIFEIEKCLK